MAYYLEIKEGDMLGPRLTNGEILTRKVTEKGAAK